MIKNYKNWISESTDFNHLLTHYQLAWCRRHLSNWKVDEKGLVNVLGSITFNLASYPTASSQFTEFPIKFGKVSGYFDCSNCTSLATLEGAPQEVGTFFSCNNCTSLTSLKGAPQKVGNFFSCEKCTSLTTLEGAPLEVVGYFSCEECTSLTTLKGSPRSVGLSFYCRGCTSLTTLEGIASNSIYCNKCPKLPKEQVELVKNEELFQKWAKSGLSIEEFLVKIRGMMHGKTFGI